MHNLAVQSRTGGTTGLGIIRLSRRGRELTTIMVDADIAALDCEGGPWIDEPALAGWEWNQGVHQQTQRHAVAIAQGVAAAQRDGSASAREPVRRLASTTERLGVNCRARGVPPSTRARSRSMRGPRCTAASICAMTALRRYVAVVVLATLLGAAVAAFLSWTRPDQYRATARLFFISSAVNVNDVYQATLAGVLRVETYKALASDVTVLNEAVREANISTDPAALQRNLHIDIPPGTLIMDISVDDPDAVTAAKLANAVSSQLIALVNEVERPLGGGPPSVGLSVIQKAVPNATPQATLDPIFVGTGAGAGLVVGAVIAFILNAVRRRRENDAEDLDPSGSNGQSASAGEQSTFDDNAAAVTRAQNPVARD